MGEVLPALEALAGPDWLVHAPALTAGDTPVRLSALHRTLAEEVSKAVRDQQRPVSIAGDCCAAIGVLAGLQRAGIDPSLIWFDAHGDFNTWQTSPSGFLGGMPLAMMVGRGDQALPQAVGLRALPDERVILTDARALDPGEREFLAASGVVHIDACEALLGYPLPEGPMYVHFDTDVVRMPESPAHNYPAPGGPSAAIVDAVFERLARSGRVVAVSVACWNPELDTDHTSATVSMALLRTLVGDV
jgi:arginase